jgi:hypothetical protein
VAKGRDNLPGLNLLSNFYGFRQGVNLGGIAEDWAFEALVNDAVILYGVIAEERDRCDCEKDENGQASAQDRIAHKTALSVRASFRNL